MSPARAIAASYGGVLAFAAFIFLGAGRLDLWQGWLYVALALVGTTLNHLLGRAGAELTVERATKAREGEAWDRRLLGLHALSSLIGFVVAGLDAGRYGWTGPLSPALTGVGVVGMLAGQILFALAKRENAFFSSTVRLQTERGHVVCDRGLYRWVRHPGYLGLLLSSLAFPLVLGALWAFLPVGLGAGLLVARTAREDRFLRERLEGYADYARRTRWRLLPGVF